NISVGLAQVLDMVKSTTGVDFQDTLQRAAEGGRAVREQSEQTRGAGLSAAAETSTEDVEDEEACRLRPPRRRGPVPARERAGRRCIAGPTRGRSTRGGVPRRSADRLWPPAVRAASIASSPAMVRGPRPLTNAPGPA